MGSQSSAFAAALEQAPPTEPERNLTGIAIAMEYAAQSILDNGVSGERLVIDISADGPDNVSKNAAEIRDKYTKPTAENGWNEIVINGLPVLVGGAYYNMTPAQFQEYFATNVIGGRGAFMEPAKGVEDISRALLRKLIREIG